ncbi:MAG: hypothetical protein IJE40_00375 [Clostridia bacterium]|nr:hypothetical protein [Clostridia bacterium]
MSEKWNIAFNDCYFENHSSKRGCSETLINKNFKWGENTIHIPVIYTCSKGLILDILIEVEPQKVLNLIDKFNLTEDEFGYNLSKDQKDEIERENPLNQNFNTMVIVNKKPIRQCRSCGETWFPYMPKNIEPSEDSKELLEHYRKSLDKAWSIHRIYFEWVTVRRPKISNIEITLSQNKANFPAEHFHNPLNGDKIEITNPINGQKHILTVINSEKQNLGEHIFEPGMEIPKNYTVMQYKIEPDPGIGNFYINDVIDPDFPRKTNLNKKPKLNIESNEASAIGIIGGIDGPIAVISSSKNNRTATSSTHFNQNYDIEWRAVFLKKQLEDVSVKLI